MTKLVFVSAYRQLNRAEKAFVDDYVTQLDKAAQKTGARISDALAQPVPDALVDASGGLLERPMVVAAITERETALAVDNEVTVQRLIREYSRIAFSNIGDYMEIDYDTGRPTLRLDLCTPEQMAAVKKINHKVSALGSEETTFELYDKQKALDALSRIVGLMVEDNPFADAMRRFEKQLRNTQAVPTHDNAGEAYAALIGA